LEKRKRVLGEEHPDTLGTMNDLAATFYEQGRLSEAEELGLRVLEKRKRVLGEEHPDILTSMSGLAITFEKQGRLNEAEELGLQVLEKMKRVLGEEYPDTLESMSNLAVTFYKQGRLSEAEELGLRVLEKRKRVLGEEHLNTLESMNNLAITVNSRGRIDESITLMSEVVALRSRLLGIDHPDTKDSAASLSEWREEKSSAQLRPKDVEDDNIGEPTNTIRIDADLSKDISLGKDAQSGPTSQEVYAESYTARMQQWLSDLSARLHIPDAVGDESRRSATLVRQDLPARHIKEEVLEDFLKRRFPSCEELEIEVCPTITPKCLF
jgi:tetratricopeptide (TPR) repeat protein